MDYFDYYPVTLPDGYVSDYSLKMNSLTKKQIDDITDSMVNVYSGYSNKSKYDISKLVAQIHELNTFDANLSTRLESENGQVLDIPDQVAMANESRNRKKPMHEIVRKNVLKKYKPSLQRKSMAQTVVGDDK